MNIFINSHNHVTSTIWSEYVSEQIRPPTPCRCCLIGITRVGSSKADPTKNASQTKNELTLYTQAIAVKG